MYQVVFPVLCSMLLGVALIPVLGPPSDGDVPQRASQRPTSIPGIERLERIDERFLVGSEPSADSIASLQQEGVKVLLSVDGRRPQLEQARELGIRVVHLPIGYDRVPPDQVRSLVRLLQEESGPFYIHCHQGKHRGPAVAAILWMLATGGSNEDACRILDRCGTDPGYLGLWSSVRTFRASGTAVEDVSDAPLPEFVPAAGLSAVMLHIEEARDRIEDTARPDTKVNLAHECLLLEEFLLELGRPGLHPGATERSVPPQHLSFALEAVRELKKGFTPARLERLDASCTGCHAATRH
ncbi:MAG: hypothetical protein CMJ57_10510 [Planctomycetaceae bacterium]|nr:hypothetical protein [Planctomycetaceae bacterium]